MNKKAAEKMISIYWFLILFIVAGAIVFMVSAFYGQPYDVREIEERILSHKVANCLSNGGYLNEDVLSNENFKDRFMEECDLTFNVENQYGWTDNSEYYLKVEIYEFNFNLEDSETEGEIVFGRELFNFERGNSNLRLFHDSDSEDNSKERIMYSIDEEGNQYTIKVLTIVRKTEKNE